MLQYDDVTKKTLGQCRLGLDDVAHVERPVHLRYYTISCRTRIYIKKKKKIEGLAVRFFDQAERALAHEEDKLDENGEGTCHEMLGTSESWSSVNSWTSLAGLPLKVVIV